MLPLKIKAKVIKGKGRGKGLGIPTINFEIPEDLNISYGVYAGRLLMNKKIYPAAIHFGHRPVFQEEDKSLEAYILDKFNENITEGELEFIKFIREIRNFPNPQEMVNQIKKDVGEIQRILDNF
ncbi:riboflavin kinase [Candidatus Gottesmanbacteria bacterium]|nr:riboflavin kinase [Candidatus Gottesmanbacteria bacterium]